MQAQNFMRVEEVAQELGISKSHAYKVIHKLNAELRDKDYLNISGRVNRNFFMEKFCYGKTGKAVSYTHLQLWAQDQRDGWRSLPES